jgi:hypothetical protein
METTMTYTAQLDALAAALTDKGFHDADAEVTIKSSGSYAPFRLEASYKIKAGGSCTYLTVRSYNLQAELGREPTVEDAFADMRRQIEELPTQREQEIKAFVNQMEALKASAEDLGVDGDFMTPIVALMNKLASNALPKPKR